MRNVAPDAHGSGTATPPRHAKQWATATPGQTRITPTILAAACAAASFLLAGCGGGATKPARASASTGVLTIGLAAAPTSLDPAKDGTGFQVTMRALAMEALTHQAADGSIQPGLAASFRYVGTGHRVFAFTLRPNVRFSDGTPLTAAAVKTWLTYFERTGGPFVSQMGPISSIDTVGQRTVVLHLGAPNPNVPAVLSENFNWGFVESPNAVADPVRLATTTDGVGPYVLSRAGTVPGNYYIFLPNKYYYDPSAIHFDRVVVRIITSPTSMVEAFDSGQLDVASGDITTVKAAAAAGASVYSAPVGTDGIVLMDRGGKRDKALANLKVRQALNYSLDRTTITTALMGKYGSPTSEIITTDGTDPAYAHYYSYDPATAKKLLAEAGYAGGLTLKVIDQGYSGTLGDPVDQAMAKYLAAVGVKLDITTAPTFAQYQHDLLNGSYPAAGITIGNTPMASTYSVLWAPKAPLNLYGSDDPTLDASFKQASAAADPTPDWQAISRRTVQQADDLWVFTFPEIYYAKSDIAGISVTPAAPFAFANEWFKR
jgi:peptide/nickel transport system substrate-binding protein